MEKTMEMRDADNSFKDTTHFILETIEMLVDVPKTRALIIAEFNGYVQEMLKAGVNPLRTARIYADFIASLKDDKQVWLLIHVNIFSIAVAEKFRFPVVNVMEALTSALNHHYARVFAVDQGLQDGVVEQPNNDEDDEELRKKFGL